jgi:hypothetical protein
LSHRRLGNREEHGGTRWRGGDSVGTDCLGRVGRGGCGQAPEGDEIVSRERGGPTMVEDTNESREGSSGKERQSDQDHN